MSYVYYNGEFGQWREIKIPLSDRAIFFGDGVYDAAVGRNGSIYLPDEHIERLVSNAAALGIPLLMSRDKLAELLYETVKKSGISDFFLYFQLSAASEERAHAPRNKERSNLLISVKEHKLPPKDRELSLISFPDRRQSFCNIKTLNLLGAVLSAVAADESGADEAVLVKDGYVTECSHSNISIIKNGKLYTHPQCEKILPGITRRHLILTARKFGIEVKEQAFSLSELFSADDVLVSSTSKLVLRAKELDGASVSLGDHEIGDALMADMRKDFEISC